MTRPGRAARARYHGAVPTRRVLAALVLLAGCSSIQEAAEDRTRLTGTVPVGLGRILEVRVEGTDERTARDLVGAVRTEFEGRDLFDRIEAAPPAPAEGGPAPARGHAARLELAVLDFRAGEVFDSWQIETGYVVRYDLSALLRDPSGGVVLEGTVTGVAVDAVSDTDLLEPARRDDMRVAALFDAASKLSRALRRAADDRARDARGGLARITLPPGTGPVQVAVLGFDDEVSARRPRGPVLAEHLAEALVGLGPDVAVVPREEVGRALEDEDTKLADLEGARLAPITAKLSARLFVVGRVVSSGGRVSAEARVLDRQGKVLLVHSAAAEGLGALRVVAVELARAIGRSLVESPPG